MAFKLSSPFKFILSLLGFELWPLASLSPGDTGTLEPFCVLAPSWTQQPGGLGPHPSLLHTHLSCASLFHSFLLNRTSPSPPFWQTSSWLPRVQRDMHFSFEHFALTLWSSALRPGLRQEPLCGSWQLEGRCSARAEATDVTKPKPLSRCVHESGLQLSLYYSGYFP